MKCKVAFGSARCPGNRKCKRGTNVKEELGFDGFVITEVPTLEESMWRSCIKDKLKFLSYEEKDITREVGFETRESIESSLSAKNWRSQQHICCLC
ncbi:MAG: hypothetical protein R2827_09565 [Bdellovibrionales bacterium]